MMPSPRLSEEDGYRDPRADWRRAAACRSVDPELFFPVSSAGPSVTQTERAKAVCATCLVRLHCLQFALVTHQQHGVWGGMSEQERRVEARRRSWTRGIA
jgi:WhiB family transcriptional regulator, redox-sensing transcriptional regulator